jgi:myo-inositol-1(or 4)-monophosphatase
VRRWGSAALDLAYVAAGRFDGFWERRLNAWDLAAGMLIVREAGGLVQPLDPSGNVLEDGTIVCANEPMFDPLAKLVRG